MTDPFEYDVFISFSSADEEIVKPIWQELCSNGLRVFWSDSTLKKEVGNSWFEVIERSLERSRHMLLVCSSNSMNSKWVQREYRAFFNYCYSPSSRRLIPILSREFPPKSLPLFLRELQVGRISDSNFIQEIIPILGGVNIEKLKQEIKSLQDQVNLLSIENELLNKNVKAESNKANALVDKNKSLKEQLAKLKEQSGVSIEKLQQECQALQEQVNLLSIENDSLNKNVKVESNKVNALVENNKSLNEQLAPLKEQNGLIKETIEEQTEKNSDDKVENTGKSEKKKNRKKTVAEHLEIVEKNNIEEAKSFRTDNVQIFLPPIGFENLNLIKIPSGWYVVFNKTTGASYKKEKNIPYDYWISKTPITYRQFYEFAMENGIPFNIPEDKSNHPVVQVSWFEANKFVSWLNTSRATGLPEKYTYALPAIDEWEKAAKGNIGFLYPWGDDFIQDYCNTEENGLDDTTPVGHYSPKGDSFYGVSDMVGNVEQWSRSSVKDTPNLVVAIGSSYRSNQSKIMKESFYRYNPNKKFNTCGFRLVAVPTFVIGKTK